MVIILKDLTWKMMLVSSVGYSSNKSGRFKDWLNLRFSGSIKPAFMLSYDKSSIILMNCSIGLRNSLSDLRLLTMRSNPCYSWKQSLPRIEVTFTRRIYTACFRSLSVTIGFIMSKLVYCSRNLKVCLNNLILRNRGWSTRATSEICLP